MRSSSPAMKTSGNSRPLEECGVVARVDEQAQVADEVAYLAALVELDAAHDLVRDPGQAQAELERALHEVHAVEERDLVRLAARVERAPDAPGDLPGLVVLVGAGEHAHAR